MPDARTHDVLTVATGAALAPLTYSYLGGPLALDHSTATTLTLWLVGAHLASGVLFSPDLDLDSAIDDRWGIFYWIWQPYTRVIPHRHFWSHSLVFAPLLRLAYFYFVVTGLLFLWVWGLARLGVVVDNYPVQLFYALRRLLADNPDRTLAVLIGFISGSAIHTIADWAVTNGKDALRMVGLRVERDYRGHDEAIHRRRRRRSGS